MKPKFKVGDKVKIVHMSSIYKGSDAWGDLGKIGIIIEIWEDGGYDWPIRVGIGDRVDGFSEDELTLFPFIKIGQQLLFDFAKE